ncbi:MAG: glycerophosphodiester phosphodiesterase family protein [Pseudomonadota bacterium]
MRMLSPAKHKPDLSWLTERPYAHRGLHDADAGIPENSLASVHAAIDAGYGIELDIQPAADQTPIVFHDEKLFRMTGQRGLIGALMPHDITPLTLKGSQEKIPTLAETLDIVAGRAPLLVEIKHHGESDGQFEMAVLEVIQNYRGPLALMSFDPSALMHLKAKGPWVPRGLVSEAYWLKPFWPTVSAGERFRRRLMLHAIRTAPHFIAYRWRDLRNPFLRIAMLLARKPLLTWTVRKPDQAATAFERRADQIIFEDYRPATPGTEVTADASA